MLNGVYHNPTAVFFGKDTESKVGEEVARYSRRILLHYGGESFKKYGLYDKITASLDAASVRFVELGGAKPNPRAGLVYEGIELCRKEEIDFILAVGGGSVIDSAKAIAIGVPWQGDFFDFFEGRQIPKAALKTAAVLTIPGSGSESSAVSVILHDEKQQKLSCTNALMYPVFSILNPELTCTLNPLQTACGIVDAISHVLERYFTKTTYVDCTDRIGEGLIKTLMKYAVAVQNEPENYDIRAEIMWACKLAQDNTAGFGRKQDWSSHAIAQELGAIYDVVHGMALGVIFPVWMAYVCKTDPARFDQFAERIFGLDAAPGRPEEAIFAAIGKYRQFLTDIGIAENLHQMGLADQTRFAEIAQKCVQYMPSGTIGNFARLAPQDIENILKTAF